MNTNLMRPNPIHSSRLTWNAEQLRFEGEMSDIGGFGRVYRDACDEGLTLISRHDGREVVFYVDLTERDSDNDVLYWDLLPVLPGDGGRIPFAIRIYND